jgi:hypothetical protein
MTNFIKYTVNGFNVIYIDDESKYIELFEDFLAGRITGELIGSFPERKTWRLTAWGRSFVVKRISAVSGKPKRRLWEIAAGHHFSRLLRETWAAIERGCDFIPRVYLAAEKFSGWHQCVDSYLIAEFVEGEVLKWAKGLNPIRRG